MAKAKKLPSGQWRTLVYSHTEYVDGKPKRKYESFTADTKVESELMARQFMLNRVSTDKPQNLPLSNAIANYIESKSSILSPATIRGYRGLARCCFQELMPVQIGKLNQMNVQSAVNKEAAKHSPKYVKNAYGLLSATLNVYRPDLNLRITLPKAIKKDIPIPTDKDVVKIIDIAKGTELYIPVLLSATLSLRRSEICGLQWRDIDFASNVISIRRAMVLSADEENREWVIKPPKTFTSNRNIVMPNSLADILKAQKGTKKANEYVVDVAPTVITNKFSRLLKRNGLPKFRFHDLRHYNASVMLALNVPDKYAMERGGWSTMSVMKDRYQHTFSDERFKHETLINLHFDNLIQ